MTDKVLRLFAKNEPQANHYVANILLVILGFDALVFVLNLLNISILRVYNMGLMMVVSAILLPIPAILCRVGFSGRPWMKYLSITLFVFTITLLTYFNPFGAIVIWLLPFVVCIQYFDRGLIIITFAECAVLYSAATFGALLLGDPTTSCAYMLLTSQGIEITPDTLFDKTVSFLITRILLLAITGALCLPLVARIRALLKEHLEYAEEKERVTTELNVATTIQTSMLPLIFPPLPNRHEVDLWASMQASKSVGGDFYDFYLRDKTTLVIVVADASGKGVPAALFSIMTKAILKSYAENGALADELFNRANRALCDRNESKMFVTAWLGMLDLRTGCMEFANAGHNPPLLKREGGRYEFLNQTKNFVLGVSPKIRYARQSLCLQPGDELFLYTDGVTEAMSADGKFFGNERLLQVLNESIESADSSQTPCKTICENVKASIATFVGKAEQSDDITMLSMRYLEAMKSKQMFADRISVPATLESLPVALRFVNEQLYRYHAPRKVRRQMSVIIDELLANVFSYAYQESTGKVDIDLRIETCPTEDETGGDGQSGRETCSSGNGSGSGSNASPDALKSDTAGCAPASTSADSAATTTSTVDAVNAPADQPIRTIISFIDSGIPFNPLEAAQADLHASAEKRESGGYGIFIVRKLLDDIQYDRIDGKNVLTVVKSFKPEMD